jgi:hypothetical protein
MVKQYATVGRRLAVWVAVLALSMFSAMPSAEAAVTPWSLAQLTLRSRIIIRGQVAAQSSAWSDDKTAIFTDSTVDVLDQIKGHTEAHRLVIRTPGGVVGDVGLWVEPAPHFVPGEEVLVFLEPLPAGDYHVVGSIQGKYTIRHGWAIREGMETSVPLVPLVHRILEIMQAQGAISTLPSNWTSRFSVPAAVPSPDKRETASSISQPLSFLYEGVHWPGPNPMGEDYLVNVNTSDVSPDAALQAIQSAASRWTNVSGADFEFTYGGPSTATDKGNNNKNDIMWQDNGNTGVLGTTWIWYWTGSNEIFEADMVINDYYQWDTSGSPASNEFDLESVALHEFGHYLHLGHDTDQNAVMYPSIAAGTVKRTLYQNDIDGIRFIYPGPANPCLTDFNNDGTVSFTDIAEMTSRWHTQAGDPNYNATFDPNADGIIDVVDIAIGTTELNQSCN